MPVRENKFVRVRNGCFSFGSKLCAILRHRPGDQSWTKAVGGWVSSLPVTVAQARRSAARPAQSEGVTTEAVAAVILGSVKVDWSTEVESAECSRVTDTLAGPTPTPHHPTRHTPPAPVNVVLLLTTSLALVSSLCRGKVFSYLVSSVPTLCLVTSSKCQTF